jgi:mono/diheme cytochrome c family protein
VPPLPRPYSRLLTTLLVAISLSLQAAEPESGQTLFAQNCASCHLLTGDAIGPPLGGITSQLSDAELLTQITQPDQVIASGDPRANALFRRYKVVMPSFAMLGETKIRAIIAYLAAETERQSLKPFAVDFDAANRPITRLIPPVAKSNLVIELEDFVQIPTVDGHPGDKGIATLRTDPRGAGAFFVSDQMGLLYRVKNRRPEVYLDVREFLPQFVFAPGIGTGLGSFAFHPNFLTNGLFYTTHAEAFPGPPAINDGEFDEREFDYTVLAPTVTPPLQWVLSEWHVDDVAAAQFSGTRREVLRLNTPTTAHGCQDMAFAPVTDRTDPDYGMLYFGIGDGGSNNLKRPELCHDPRSLLGTLFRIDPRGQNAPNGQYGIPPDNPFAHATDPAVHREIWAYGFRNPHRFSWDMRYGKRLFLADIGETNVEELNLIEGGGDYGWSTIEGTTRIDIMTDAKVVFPATATELAPYRLPFAQYDHEDGKAISGGFVYLGPLEALHGKYVFGDIVTGRLFFVNLDATLSDSTVYELNLIRDGLVTTVKTLSNLNRAHLRIGYDDQTHDLFVMTKADGMIRRVSAAYTP